MADSACPRLAAEVPRPQRSDPLSHLGDLFSSVAPDRRWEWRLQVPADVSWSSRFRGRVMARQRVFERLVSFRMRLECGRAEVADTRVAAARSGETFDVVEDGDPRVAVRAPAAAVNQLTLQGCEQ